MAFVFIIYILKVAFNRYMGTAWNQIRKILPITRTKVCEKNSNTFLLHITFK